jgi:hypothetical protein
LTTAEEVIRPHYGHGASNRALLVFEEKMDANHEKMLANLASFLEKIDARNAELDAHYEKTIAI